MSLANPTIRNLAARIRVGQLIPTRSQALRVAKAVLGFRGICAQCGCTERNACTDQGFFEETCAWANKEQTLCSNAECVKAANQPVGYNPSKPKNVARCAPARKGEHHAK